MAFFSYQNPHKGVNMWGQRLCLLITGVVLLFSCMNNATKEVSPYESLVWTNSWVEVRKRELALPLEFLILSLEIVTPIQLSSWEPSLRDELSRQLFALHRMVSPTNADTRVYVVLYPIRSQSITTNRIFYEIRGDFTIWIGTNLFRSNVVVFEQAIAFSNYPEISVYNHLIKAWCLAVAENIHYGWSVSQDFLHIPILGETNESTSPYPWY